MRLSLWMAVVCAAMLCLRSAAWAQAPDPNAPAVRLISTIPINGTAGNRATKMFSFGSSWVGAPVIITRPPFDASFYFLADRSNASIDVIDATGRFTGTPDSFFGQIGGAAFNFAGDTGSDATSGPNGVTISAPCIFVTDGNSRVVSINANVSFVQPVASVSTGGQFRANGLAFGFAGGTSTLLVINDTDTPPFASTIPVDPVSCALGTPFRIPLKTALLNPTNGAGQPVFFSGFFYIAIPEVNGPGGGGPNGGIARITNSGIPSVDAFYPINFCQPSGLAMGSVFGDLLVQCSTVFDASGAPCTAVFAASETGTGAAPATCEGIAHPQVAICNVFRSCLDGALVSVPGPGGGAQVWFNFGFNFGSDQNYYITGENNPVGPNFGVVKAGSNILTQLVPTLPPVPAVPGVHSEGSVHSIAASPVNNHIYVPLPANTSYPNCTQGCVAVFSAQ